MSNAKKCSYCKFDVSGIELSKLNNKCPRCRSGMFTVDSFPRGDNTPAAPRDRQSFIPPDLQRGNILMPNDPNIPSQ